MDLRSQLQSTLGDAYTIDHELGGGGMSRVFLATERALGRQVVIKVLPSETPGAVSIERFRREIALVAQLQHPHIVPMHTAGEVGGLPWFAMPFVRGESLRARLAREGELPISDAVRVLREVASALAYAHESGIVHRDIKPDNVLISGGAALVTDFGVAKAVASSTEIGTAELTTRGVALGTPAYMSPEQASADPHVDHRADLYSWGILAYELLTGTTPFSGRAASAILAAHITEAAEPVGKRRPAIPQALAALVMRCVEKRPADRPQTAAEIIRVLDAVSTPSGGSSVAVIPARRPNRWIAVSIAGAISLAAFALYKRPLDTYVAGTATAVVSSSDQLEHDPAISPDAKFMAYSVGPLMQRRIEVRPISGGRTIRLAEAVGGDHRSPRWSPDGSSILFVADSKLYTVPAFGGEPRLLYRQATPFALSADWSPRGDAFVFVSNDTIWTRSVDGGATTHLASGGDISSPAWAPDGRYIAFVRGNSAYMQVPGNVSPSTIWVVPGQGGAPWPVTDSTGMHHSPVWSSDSRSIFFVSNLEGTRDVYRIRLSSDARRRGVPQRVTSGLHAATISLDASGTRLAYAVLFLRRNVWAVAIPPAGASSVGRPHQLTSGNQTVEGVHVSHDGRWLLFDSNASGNQDVYKLDLTDTTGTAQPVQLTRDPGDDFLARFSPNDREIVFYSVRTGTRDVFVMTAEGSDVQRVTDLAGHELYPDWSPDGSRVVWGVSGSGTSASIGIVDRAGVGWSPPRLISVPDCSARSMFPRWAPNGAWISVPCQTEGVALVSPDGAKRRIVRVPGVDVWYADWASDPNVVYVKARPSGQIWAVPLTSGSPRLVFSPSDPRLPVARHEFATDGRRLFFTLSSDESDIWVMELSKK